MSDTSRPLVALSFMLGATASFTAMAVAGRELAGKLDTFEIMTFRSMIGLAIVLMIAVVGGQLYDIRARKMKLHFIRNLCHFTGQNLWFYAVALIPFSQLFAFEFSVPLWVALAAPFLLNEKLTRVRIAAAGIGFFGILLVARPDTVAISPGVIAAFLCAIAFAGATIGTKILTKTENTISIMFWLTSLQLFFGLIGMLWDMEATLPDGESGPWVIVVGLCGLTAHYCITKAMSYAPATVVMPLDFARLPVISVIGMIYYDEPLLWMVAIGGAIIFAANYMNIRAEQKSGKQA
ncbi:MAG: DMT family transporter [Pikeienuella sp.]